MKFKLLRGLHVSQGRTYEVGDMIETDTDLAKRFNVSGSLKFEQLIMDEKSAPPSPVKLDPAAFQEAAEAGYNSGEELLPLHKLSVMQLRRLAKQRGIDLGDLAKKIEIIECLEEALAM